MFNLLLPRCPRIISPKRDYVCFECALAETYGRARRPASARGPAERPSRRSRVANDRNTATAGATGAAGRAAATAAPVVPGRGQAADGALDRRSPWAAEAASPAGTYFKHVTPTGWHIKTVKTSR